MNLKFSWMDGWCKGDVKRTTHQGDCVQSSYLLSVVFCFFVVASHLYVHVT